MTTLTKTYAPGRLIIKVDTLKQRYDHLMEKLDFSYFAFISFCIAVSACLGGGLVKFSLEYNTVLWQFILGTSLSIMNIVVCVAQFPIRWVFKVFVISTIINTLLILISVL